MKWTDEQIADAVKWHLKEHGYIDTNTDDFDVFMQEWMYTMQEQREVEEYETNNWM